MSVVIDKILLRYVTLEELTYKEFYNRDERLPFIHFEKGFADFQKFIATHSLNDLEDAMKHVVDKNFLTGNQEHNDIFTMFKMIKLTNSFLDVGMKQPMCASAWRIGSKGDRILVEEQGNTRLMCCRILDYKEKIPVVVTDEKIIDAVDQATIKEFADTHYRPEGSELMPTPIMTSLTYMPLIWKDPRPADWWASWNKLDKNYIKQAQNKMKERQIYMYNSYNKYSLTRNINYKAAAEKIKDIDVSKYQQGDLFKKCLEVASKCI